MWVVSYGVTHRLADVTNSSLKGNTSMQDKGMLAETHFVGRVFSTHEELSEAMLQLLVAYETNRRPEHSAIMRWYVEKAREMEPSTCESAQEARRSNSAGTGGANMPGH